MSDPRLTAGWRLGAETVWLPTAGEMAELDRDATTGGATTERALIEAAGREIAHRIGERWPEGRVGAVAGGGHNGADALVALRCLKAWGREVFVVQAGPSLPEPDVLSGWPIQPAGVDELPALGAGASVLIDGILGTGLSGPPRSPQAAVIEAVNELGRPVVAVDGPSGADLTSGAVCGACVRATLTVSLGWPKLGLLRYPTRRFAGDIVAVEIGFPPPRAAFGARAITGRWVRRLLRPRAPDAHKRQAGYLTLVAGREGMAGAAVLAARAALRGGVGILRIVSDPRNREIVQRSVPGAIFVSWDDAEEVAKAVRWAGAVAIGPGLGRGPESRDLVERILAEREERPALLDADGLSVWEGEAEVLAGWLTDRDVITPHPGELARVLGRPVADVTDDPPARARSTAELLGCGVLLKGAPSVFALAGEPLRVATLGGGALAAGGTGDVLTGLIGAGLAAGMNAADASTEALFLSALAAMDSAEPVGHIAEDLPDRLPAARATVAGLPETAGGAVFFALDSAERSGAGAIGRSERS